jgi:hypothetical protein
MTRGHPEIVATARLVEKYAIVYESAQRVLDQQWSALDWHTAGGSEHVTASPDNSPVEAALGRKLSLEADYAQLDDDRRTIATIVHSALTVAYNIANRIPPERHQVPRCDGKIDPSCTEAASDHRDRNGSLVAGMCDRCFIAACPNCYQRPAENRRKITIDGRQVAGCEPCARREWRQEQRTGSHST